MNLESITSLRRAGPAEMRALWSKVSQVPGGKQAFSRLIGLLAPYTGSIHPQVRTLEDGFCQVALADRRRVRNHLRCVHALALANLGELTGSLALTSALPKGTRFIPIGLSIDYLKKARGTIVAECHCPPISSTEKRDYVLDVNLMNAARETVATLKLKNRVGPAS